MINVTFLGTSSMVPTTTRNVPATYLEYKGEGILIDCGEGAQRQMSIAGISRSKVKKILITHWHADHTAGLLGLLQTINNRDNPFVLHIIGPVGTKAYLDHMMKATVFDNQLELNVEEFDCPDVTTVYENQEYFIQAANLQHGPPCLGFSFIEKDRRRMKVKKLEELGIPPGPIYAKLQKGNNVMVNGKKVLAEDVTSIVSGKKLTLITDTVFCQNAVALAQEADTLICEATYAQEHEQKAEEHNHMTSTQAAQIASMANVGNMYLFHFSQRYTSTREILEDAKDVFENTTIANDFMKMKVQ